MKGKRIMHAKTIRELVDRKRAIIGEPVWCRRPIPAAMVINMPLRMVLVGIDMGLWIYEKKKEIKKPAQVGKSLRGIAQALEKSMQCNCDLDNWQPEGSTGHSCVCRIHKAALERDKGEYR